jgi:hypothetical protein
MRRLLGLLLFASALLSTAVARADDAKCVAAFEETQSLRNTGRLRAARERAIICASDACPKVTTKDCMRWLTEIEQATPSIVFIARGANGAELDTARIIVDGKLAAERFDGRAQPLDPGPHEIGVESSGRAPFVTKIVLAEGEKNRRITIPFDTKPEDLPRPIPTVTWAFGGVAATAMIGTAFFGIRGLVQKGDLDDSKCSPGCNADEVNSMTRNLAVADVLFGVALVATVAGVVTYLMRPPAGVSPKPLTSASRTTIIGIGF